MKVRPGGRVRAMNVRVAGNAAAAHDPLIGMQTSGKRLRRVQIVRMALLGVALLTQERDGCDKQRVLVGAMRRVTIEAAPAYRRVLEQERPALFGMTLVAGLVD